MPVLVRYGERSYVLLEVREPGERAEEIAGRLNGQLGVTKQQQAAMSAIISHTLSGCPSVTDSAV